MNEKLIANKQITITRKIHFCSGHRVWNHESKCATMHGHNYNLYVTATANELDSIGRIIDFSILKEKIGDWIDNWWDHNFLVYEKDIDVIRALKTVPRKKEPFVCNFNPTAENMALYLLNVVCPKLMEGTGVTIMKIVLFETENCSATVEI